MSESEFLKDLPSFDKNNFMLFNYGHSIRNNSKRPSIYLSTKDIPSDQIIVNDKTHISLKYLHEQWDKEKNVSAKKRDLNDSEQNEDEVTSRKRLRLTTHN